MDRPIRIARFISIDFKNGIGKSCFTTFCQKRNTLGPPRLLPGWSTVLRKFWWLEMPADWGGVEGFGGLVGAVVFFAFGKIGKLRWLLAVAAARETALERGATALRRFALSALGAWATGQGRGRCAGHAFHHASSASTAAEQRLAQRLPQRLRAAYQELDG